MSETQDEMTPEHKLKLLVAHRPWETEPSHEEWVHTPTRYKCKIRRHPDFLHLCGYVGIPYGHVWYGQSYNDTNAVSPPVHGGVTFSGRMPETKGRAVWWLGFDCGHSGDMSPGILMKLMGIELTPLLRLANEEYRDIDYVRSECNLLADNLYRIDEEHTTTRVMLAAQKAARLGVPIGDALKRSNNVRRKK
jgi:hypothetical protein